MGKALKCIVASLLFPASGYRTSVSLNSNTEWKTQPEGPRQCRINWDVHVWIEHKENCQKSSKSEQEKFGCNLPDFTTKKYLNQGTEVHWYGGNKNQTHFFYLDGEEGTCGNAYKMPDYCSRAIVSELSTVYNGYHRSTSLLAGAKVLFNTLNENCDDIVDDNHVDEIYNDTIAKDHKSKACWNMAQDWRKLWCSKYARCSCDLSNGDCLSKGKVQCCRDMYQLFLDGHPDERELFEKYIGTSVQTARTSFSMFAVIEIDGFRAGGENWVRVGYRVAATHGLPTVFLEYSKHATFLEPGEVIDLCKYKTKMPHSSNVPPYLGFILELASDRNELHEFKFVSKKTPGPSLIGKFPKTDKQMVDHINNLVLKYCRL